MFTSLETLMSEAGQALRRLAREWGFVAAFVVTLALGIGANGAIFTALNTYLLRPLPYPQANALANVYVGSHALTLPAGYTSPTAAALLGATSGVASWGMYSGSTATVISNGEPKSVGAVGVSASLFKTLGVRPLLGRWIDPASDRPDGEREVVVSYRFWQSALGGAASAVGEPLKIDGEQYLVVGVMPRSFVFPDRSVRLWHSVALAPEAFHRKYLLNYVNWSMVVRRAPGVAPETLRAALAVQLTRFASPVPKQNRAPGLYVGVIPLRQWFGGATGERLLLMQLGAVLLLILAAANLGNLALVRTLRRRQELGLRLTLGASRFALLRLTLIETLPLGLIAAMAGWLLSRVGAQALAHFGIASGATAFAIGSGGLVALYGVLLSLAITFLALGAPLYLIRAQHLTALMQTSGRSIAGGKGTQRTRKGLSILQIALAVMLLSMATLIGLSLQRMLARNPGFDSEHLAVASITLRGPQYQSTAQIIGAWHAAQAAVQALPGMQAAAIGNGIPFAGDSSYTAFFRTGAHAVSGNPGLMLTANVSVALPKLLHTLGFTLLSGRALTTADVQGEARVVVVDAQFAQAMFGTTKVVGKEVRAGGPFNWRIVGVVAPITDRFTQENQGNLRGRVIFPLSATALDDWVGSSFDIVLRSRLPLTTVTRELKTALTQALPGQAITRVASMRELIGESAQGTSALATLLIAFGLLAFALASVGTYGVVAYLTRLRRREFAIRIALGARPWQIEWLVLAQGIALWACGAALGIGLGILLARFMAGALYEVSLLSPAAYIVPALVLGCVVTVASWLPARHVHHAALAESLNPE